MMTMLFYDISGHSLTRFASQTHRIYRSKMTKSCNNGFTLGILQVHYQLFVFHLSRILRFVCFYTLHWFIQEHFYVSWYLIQCPIWPQITKFMGPTWGPPGSCRPQLGPMLAPWTLLPGTFRPQMLLYHGCMKFALLFHNYSDICQILKW